MAVAFLAVLPMYGLALYTASQERRRQAVEAEENAARLAALVGLEEKRLLDQTRALLITLSDRLDLAESRHPDCTSAFSHTLAHFQRYDNIVVIELDGTLSCSALPLRGRINVADREYFRRAIDTADFAFGTYDRERVTGKPALICAYPVTDRAGRPRRVIAAAIDLARLSRFEETVETQLPAGASVTKTDREGRILAVAPYAPARIGTLFSAFDALRPIAAQGSGAVRIPDDRGVSHLYAVARVSYSARAGDVFVILGIAEAVAYAEIHRALQRATLGLGALTLLIAATTWLVTTVTIRRPLQDLLAATRRIAGGALDHRVGPRSSFGEFRCLAQSFDAMAEALQARESALAKSEARYRALFENAPYGIFTTDASGRFLEVNPAFVAILGYDAARDVLGKEASAFYEVEEQGERLARLLREQAQVQGFEVRLKRRDGHPVLVRAAGRLVRDQRGEVVAHQVIVEDVTEQRALEEQFRQAQKLEALGRLAGGIAHDFNNLLTVILGYTDLIRDELSDSLRGDLDEVREAALRAKSLTGQLLAFSRRQLLEAEPVNLNRILEGTVKMMRRLLGEDVELVTSFEPELGTVRADRGQIEQVVLNLAVNARDAMPRGGKLVLETRNEDLTSPALHGAVDMPPGRYVTLTVADTGIGMDAETRARIFEPFFTIKERGKGTGLGLSTVYGIIKQSGGFVWVYSDVGKGARFRIYLPRIDEAPAISPPPEAEMTLAGSGERILLVEDDDSVRSVTERILAARGYQVLQAKTGEDAIELARRVQGAIDRLVTDVVLPGMSGPEVAAQLASGHALTRVVYVSGYLPETVGQFLSLGSGARILQKPFTADALLRRIREVLQERT